MKKGAQINILANKIATQLCLNIIIKESKQTMHYIYFIFSCYYDVHITLIKKLELCLMVVSALSKIKFGHAQINVPKIGIPMSKTACINPCSSFQQMLWPYIFSSLYILKKNFMATFYGWGSTASRLDPL